MNRFKRSLSTMVFCLAPLAPVAAANDEKAPDWYLKPPAEDGRINAVGSGQTDLEALVVALKSLTQQSNKQDAAKGSKPLKNFALVNKGHVFTEFLEKDYSDDKSGKVTERSTSGKVFLNLANDKKYLIKYYDRSDARKTPAAALESSLSIFGKNANIQDMLPDLRLGGAEVVKTAQTPRKAYILLSLGTPQPAPQARPAAMPDWYGKGTGVFTAQGKARIHGVGKGDSKLDSLALALGEAVRFDYGHTVKKEYEGDGYKELTVTVKGESRFGDVVVRSSTTETDRSDSKGATSTVLSLWVEAVLKRGSSEVRLSDSLSSVSGPDLNSPPRETIAARCEGRGLTFNDVLNELEKAGVKIETAAGEEGYALLASYGLRDKDENVYKQLKTSEAAGEGFDQLMEDDQTQKKGR